MAALPLREARGALQRVGDAGLAALPFLLQGFAQRQIPLGVGALAVGAHRGLREGGELPRKGDGRFARLAGGHHAVGQAHLQRFGGFHRAAGEDQVHRVAHADQARQAHGAAVDQRHAEASAIDAEVGVGFHHAQVAPERELHAAGHGRAAHRGDDGFGQAQARRTHGAEGARVLRIEVELI
ncbi:hypothetical protein FQZ97_857010 [compost metagenome]